MGAKVLIGEACAAAGDRICKLYEGMPSNPKICRMSPSR